MREFCPVNNENHFAIHSENKEQDEKLLSDAESSLAVRSDKAYTNSIDSDERKVLEDKEKVYNNENSKDNDNGTGEHHYGRKRNERKDSSESTDANDTEFSDEARNYGNHESETAMAIVRSKNNQQKTFRDETALSGPIKINGSPSLSRKRKLDISKSTLSVHPKVARNENVSKRKKLISSCLSSTEGDIRDVHFAGQREGSWLSCEEFNEIFSENGTQDISDDDYNGVDEIELSEDESQLTFLEEKHIIDSELRSMRGHRGAFGGGDSRQSLSESDFPELFGHPDDSVPTYTSDAGFLYETDLASSRKYYDSPTKRVRFEDITRISDLGAHDIDISDSDFNSEVLLHHTPSHAGCLISQSCYGMGDVMQNSDDKKNEVQVNVGSSDDSHVNAVQTVSASECDDSDLFEASSSDFDTDDGDTTDEEDPPAHAHIHNPHSKLQRKLSPSIGERSANSSISHSRSLFRNGPVMGQFVVDPRKAIVVLDNRKLKLFPARLPRTSRSTDSSDSTTSESYQPSTQLQSLIAQNSLEFFEATPLDIMLCRVFTSNPGPDSLRGQVIGPPEAFYPFTSITVNGTIASNDDDDLYDCDDNEEIIKNLHELVDFGDISDTDFGRDSSTELANGACVTVRRETFMDDAADR